MRWRRAETKAYQILLLETGELHHSRKLRIFVGVWQRQTFAAAALAAFLIGFAAGAELDLMAFLAARYFGLAHYAKIYSILYATLAVYSGTAPMVFASVYDATGSYDLGYSIASGLFLVSVVLILLLGRYPKEYEGGH